MENKCQGQGALTGEVAVQADGDIVKSHGGSGSLSPPRDNLQPEPVHVLKGVCVRNNLGWPRLRIQHPANSADTLRLTVFSSLTSPQSNCKRGAVARGEQSASLLICPAQSTALSEGLFRVLIQSEFGAWV